MTKDKEYWEKYYSNQNLTTQPSPFAQFVFENYLNPGMSLVELGCGNGRDSIFFAHEPTIQVLAIDQCENETHALAEQNKLPNLRFEVGDFTNFNTTDKFDVVYSRFTFHSVSEDGEDRTIKWSYENLNSEGLLLIEVRGQKNELYKLGDPVTGEQDAFIYEDHYRRFSSIETLIEKITKTGFQIISAEEKSGFAPFKDTDYVFIRIIARK